MTPKDHLRDFIEAVGDECGVPPKDYYAAIQHGEYEPALRTITNYIMECNRTHLGLLRKIQIAIQRYAD